MTYRNTDSSKTFTMISLNRITNECRNSTLNRENMQEQHKHGEGMYCNSSWDNVSCWPRTPAGSHASIPCPSYLVGINEANNATKYCNSNGTWASKAIYDLCIPEEEPLPMDQEVNHLMAIRVIYNVGFSVSTLALVVALYIFLYFRSLRCLRNSIHCHLIVTFIVKNILWIIMRHVLTYLQQPAHAWVCKTLISLFNFATATNFFWMFVEGLYLHVIIVWTFSADKIRLSYLLLIGWGMPALNIVAWVIVKSRLEEKGEKKAVKATIILFPLLGITYVLFIISPSDHPQVKLVFNIINAVLQSFQGLLVAVFYCFLNGEVKGVLKKRISRFNDARTLSTKFTRASYGGWTRNSEYGHTSVSHAGNGSVVDPVRSTAVKSFPPESIPLTDTNVDSDQIECL
ncbi:CRFR2-like protein [Mya arenaria]|uniref:CRFR2-like protein n=1 Tax=Mya arenaria TaxID=6604 RepID=A0ABY7DA76_MYAAR|nr:CRFR2-like protein [Mya arenaria]